MGNTWTPETWRSLIAAQQPDWNNTETYNKVIQEIAQYPPLVFAGEVQSLKQQLAEAAKGKGFLVQGGVGVGARAYLANSFESPLCFGIPAARASLNPLQQNAPLSTPLP